MRTSVENKAQNKLRILPLPETLLLCKLLLLLIAFFPNKYKARFSYKREVDMISHAFAITI